MAVPTRSRRRGERDAALRLQRQESEGARSRRLSQPDLPRRIDRRLASSSTTGSVAPGLRPTTLGGRGGSSTLGSGQSNYDDELSELAASAIGSREERAGDDARRSAGARGGQGNKETDIRISAIEENNQLMIQATPIEWARIEAAIKKLDIMPLQVQIEARILEVSLTGDLNYGVQWYLTGLIGTATGSAQANGRYPYAYPPGRDLRSPATRMTAIAVELGATGSTAPTNNGGFFYSFLNKNFEVAISALETSGQAKSLAAPSLLVANNQEAQINVGQQIPIVQTYYNGLGTVSNTNGTTALAHDGIGAVPQHRRHARREAARQSGRSRLPRHPAGSQQSRRAGRYGRQSADQPAPDPDAGGRAERRDAAARWADPGQPARRATRACR